MRGQGITLVAIVLLLALGEFTLALAVFCLELLVDGPTESQTIPDEEDLNGFES